MGSASRAPGVPGLRTAFPGWENTEALPPPGQDPVSVRRELEFRLSVGIIYPSSLAGSASSRGTRPLFRDSFQKSKGPGLGKGTLPGALLCLCPPSPDGEADLARLSSGSVLIAAYKILSSTCNSG